MCPGACVKEEGRMTPADLVVMEEIKRVKYRYLRALDTGDLALLATLFTEDVTAHYRGGSYDVKLAGKPQLLEFLAASSSPDVVMNHNCHHPEIDLTGPESAQGLWYLSDWTYNRVQQRTTHGSALYRDRYTRSGNAWKISHTGYERVFEIVADQVTAPNFTANLLGSRGGR
jgi:SnoaL-like protein